MQKVYSGDLSGFVEIPGFTKYLINREGIVISMRSGEPKIVSVWIAKNGYPSVTIKRDGDERKFNKYIHRLLAEMFIENPDNYVYVRHYDDNKLNNELSNLRWGSA